MPEAEPPLVAKLSDFRANLSLIGHRWQIYGKVGWRPAASVSVACSRAALIFLP